MATFKVKRGDETVDVEYDEIVEAPEGYLSAEEVQKKHDRLEEDVQKRLGKAKRNERKEIRKDDEFLQEVAKSKWGLKFEDGKPKTGSDVDVEEIRNNIRSTLEKDEIDPLRKENQQLRQTTLSNAVIRAATKYGIKEEKLREAYKGKSLLELQALDNFDYDPETGRWAKTKNGGEGFEITSQSDSDYPYVTPEEWVASLKQSPDHQDWFKDQTQGGSKFGGGGSPKNENDFDKKVALVRKIRGVS